MSWLPRISTKKLRKSVSSLSIFISEKGGKVNAKNGNGEAPLHDSIKRGDKDIVEELILHGANCHIVPIKG